MFLGDDAAPDKEEHWHLELTDTQRATLELLFHCVGKLREDLITYSQGRAAR
jgi:hypothetical protein